MFTRLSIPLVRDLLGRYKEHSEKSNAKRALMDAHVHVKWKAGHTPECNNV